MGQEVPILNADFEMNGQVKWPRVKVLDKT